MFMIIRWIPENFQEEFCNIVFSSSTANYSLLPRMILEIWEILDITSVGELLFAETVAKSFSEE